MSELLRQNRHTEAACLCSVLDSLFIFHLYLANLIKRPVFFFPHQGMKEFKCDVCSREFTLSANLKRHMLIHASVRPFQCHVCFKTFVQKQTLKTHMIVHLPVKPFKCKVGGEQKKNTTALVASQQATPGTGV